MKNEFRIQDRCRDIRLIVCDLDGTLLRDDKTLSAYTLSVLRRARERGLTVTFCTARVPEMAQTYAKLVEVCGPFIACGGAVIWDTENFRSLYAELMEPADTKALLEWCSTHVKDYGIITDEGCWFSPDSKRIERFIDYNSTARAAKVPEIPLHIFSDCTHKEACGKNIYKIAINDLEPGDCQCVKDYVDKRPGRLSYLVSEEAFLDVFRAGVNKGRAVKKLADILGISGAQVCAFGDFDSDNSMLMAAGVGVAMGNAANSTKQCADYITATNEEDGVAVFLERFVL